jgi:hypothetical protein
MKMLRMRGSQLAARSSQLAARAVLSGTVAGVLLPDRSHADVTIFQASTSNPVQRLAWEEQVGTWSTIDFIGLPDSVPLPPDTYAEEFGVTFENGTILSFSSDFFFPVDGHGFAASQGAQGSSVDVVFDTPIKAFATDHPGTFRFILFSEGEMVFDSGIVGGAIGYFSGLISDTPFDRVRISDTDEFGVDDIRFGLVVPAPAAGLILVPGLAMTRRRRRTG